MAKIVKLTSPVVSEGADITELNIREPIGEDLTVCGYPFRIYLGSETDVDAANKKEQEMKIDTLALTNLASRLSGVPKSTIKRLSVKDYQAVVNVVLDFFE